MTMPYLSGHAHDRQTLRWCASLGSVLAVHAIIVAAVLWWRAGRAPEPWQAPAQAVMVELSPVPTAPPAAPTELPPGPPQREQHKSRPKATLRPQPKPRLPPQRVPQAQAEVAEPSPAQEKQVEQNANTEVAQTSAPPSVKAAPGHYAARQSLSGVVNQKRVTWQAQLLGHLQNYKRYPRAAQRRHQEGTVNVRFSVDRQGRVSDARIAGSSGHDSLDSEALATLQRANPLPPPPPEIKGDPVVVIVPVDFFLRRH